MKELVGTYVGFVEDVNDPERLGRVKVRVILVYGPVNGAVGTEDLPWALPAGLPAGGSAASGGMNWLPNPGDQVYVRFLDGEPEKPVWEWATQSRAQRQALSFRRYDGRVPRQEIFTTRFNHTSLWDAGGISFSTRAGYAFLLQDADPLAPIPNGLWELRTSKGHFVSLEDETDSLTSFASQVLASFDDLTWLGDTANLRLSSLFDADGGDLARLRADRVELGTEGANDAIVRQSDLQGALNQVAAWANTHTHPTVGPTTSPLSVTARGSQVSFSA